MAGFSTVSSVYSTPSTVYVTTYGPGPVKAKVTLPLSAVEVLLQPVIGVAAVNVAETASLITTLPIPCTVAWHTVGLPGANDILDISYAPEIVAGSKNGPLAGTVPVAVVVLPPSIA
jgi:hypothetical protein